MITLLKRTYLFLVYALLYCPIIIMIIYGFNQSAHSMIWRGFSMKWYHVLFHDRNLWLVLSHSLSIALIASSIACLLGSIAALCLFRYRFFGKSSVQAGLFSLIIMPDIVIAISLLLLYRLLHIPLGFWSLLLAHISFSVPFVSVIVYSRLNQLNRSVFEAAIDLGANETTVIRKIIVPLIASAMIAGWLLSFTLSIDDVVISYFVSGPNFDILPLKIYAMVRLGVKPEINALCSLMFVATLIMVISVQYLLRRKQGAK